MDEKDQQQTQNVIVKYNEEGSFDSDPYLLLDKSQALSFLIPNTSNKVTHDEPELSTSPFLRPSTGNHSHTIQGIQPGIGWDHENGRMGGSWMAVTLPEPFVEKCVHTTTLLNNPVRKRVNVTNPYFSTRLNIEQ